MYDFSGQTVIITGGTRGIGKGIAKGFLSAGANVVATYQSNSAAAEAMKTEAGDSASRLDCIKCDVANYAEVEQLFKLIDEKYQKFEVVINNAGIKKDGLLGMMKPDDWNSVIQTNLTGMFNVSKMAVRSMMRKRYGRIVNITSPVGRMGLPGQTNYGASKAGMVGFTKSLAKEVASRNITVNCVSPGFIDTELLDDISPELKETYTSMIPLKRFGTVDDIANAVQFVSSKEAGYITGAVIEVTGGV